MWKTATSGEIAHFAVLGNTLAVAQPVCETTFQNGNGMLPEATS